VRSGPLSSRNQVNFSSVPGFLWGALALYAAVFLIYSDTRAFSWDESYHLLASQLIDAGRRPYIDFCFPQAPLNAYWDAGWMRILGQSWRVTHAIAALLTIGAVVLMADFVYRRFAVPSWPLAVGITAGLNPLVFRYGSLALGYGMCLFSLAAAFRIAARSVHRSSPLLPAAAGLCAGIASGSSLLSAAAAPVFVTWLLFYNRAGSRSKKLFAFAIGAAIPFAPVCWLFWQGPRQTWFNLIQYHLFFRRLYWPSATRHDLEVITSWISSGPAILTGALAAIGYVFVRRSNWPRTLKAEFYLCAWLTAALSIEAFTTHPTFPRYFVLSLPFVAILGAAGIYSLAGDRRVWPALLLAALLALGLGRSLYGRSAETDWRVYEQRARKVDEVTPRSALLLADEPIYFLTRRTPPPGFELYYTHKINLPAPDRALFHIITDEEIKRQKEAGMFATAYSCDEDDVNEMGKLYKQYVRLGECEVLWGWKN
jgi:hypothetical protein